jgi:peptidoglycan/xylan/chitin deacetylase (PgdA/CDA1 family)
MKGYCVWTPNIYFRVIFLGRVLRMSSRRDFLKKCLAIGAMGSFLPTVSGTATSHARGIPRIPVLLYHRIGDTGGHLTVTTDQFDDDLSRLADEGYESIPLHLFQSALRGDEVILPQRPIVITFDDGYLDNYLNAFSVLRKHNMTATFFIITSLLGEYDRLAVGHIREMQAAGMTFGSHTVSHRSLGDLEQTEVEAELKRSKIVMEDLLRRKIDYIAYPKGSFNPLTIQAAENIGYRGGFSIHPGVCTSDTNPYILRRIPVFSFDSNVMRAMAKRGRA